MPRVSHQLLFMAFWAALLYRHTSLNGRLDSVSGCAEVADAAPTTTTSTTSSNRTRETIALCVIQKDEERYLDSFLDYHLAIGFDHVFLLDNSETVMNLTDTRNGRVSLIHFPGKKMQMTAYNKCATSKAMAGSYTYATFLDVDEYVALFRHNSVLDMVQDHLPSTGGQLQLRWRMFGFSGQYVELDLPVPVRFACSGRNIGQSTTVKTIIRVSDFVRMRDPHCAFTKQGDRYSTKGKQSHLMGSKIREPVYDVAAVYHYYSRSRQEYVAKRRRGDIQWPGRTEQLVKQAEQGFDSKNPNGVPGIGLLPQSDNFDHIVWQTLKQRLPRYAEYEKSGEYLLAAKNWSCPGAPYEDGHEARLVREQEEVDKAAFKEALKVFEAEKAAAKQKKANEKPK